VAVNRQKPKGFWFNVNAELVVYGSTEPNAQVMLGGRPVQLRADGTFSFRFALPDGRYALPASAYSVEGDAGEPSWNFSATPATMVKSGCSRPSRAGNLDRAERDLRKRCSHD